MVGGTLVLLVIAGVDLVRGDDSAPTDTVQQVVGTPGAAPSDGATTTAPGKRKGKKKKAYTPPPPTVDATVAPAPAPTLPQPEGACADSDVAITPVMQPAVARGPVLVSLALRTLESPACTWKVDREHLAYRISSGDEEVWSSSHCPAQVPEDDIVLRRSTTGTYRLAWTGRTSSRDCPGGADWAAPGDYTIQASAIGGEPSAAVPFTLTDPDKVAGADGPLGPPLPAGVGKNKNKGKNKPRG